jgi:Ser/Thr protein kinase RdoA (MazF antagonist)
MKSYQQLTPLGRARRLRQMAWNALAQYDLNVTRLSLITNDTNGIFRVDTFTGEKWILRVTAPEGGHNRDHVTAEMDWLAALAHDTHLSVPRPLPTRNGKFLVEANTAGVPEPRLCEIFSWVPGADLVDRLTPTNTMLFGELMAHLHEHARTYCPPAGVELLTFDRVFPFPEPVVLFEDRFRSIFTSHQLNIFRQAVDLVQIAIDLLKASNEPMRIIHGDFHPWNVRIARGVLSPIDFEDLMWGWPVQDIAISLYYSLDKPNYPEIRSNFEQGYRRVNPWPERYEGEIDGFIAARGIGLLNFVLNNHKILQIDPHEFALRIEKRLKVLRGKHPVKPDGSTARRLVKSESIPDQDIC